MFTAEMDLPTLILGAQCQYSVEENSTLNYV